MFFFLSLICIFGEWPTDSLTWTTFSRVDLLVACHFHLSFRLVAFVWALNWLSVDAIAATVRVVLIEGKYYVLQLSLKLKIQSLFEFLIEISSA